MSYTTKPGEAKADIHKKYAKLRTETGHKNALLRSAYEKQVNQQLRETVELERQHFQRQVDEMVARANKEIQKANAEANHWRIQTEQIYALLEDTTVQAETEIARLKTRIVELEAGIKPAKKKKPKRMNPKRELE